MSPSSAPADVAAPSNARGGRLDRLARSLVLARLAALRHGRITFVEDGGGRRAFGDAAPDFPVQATVRVRDPSAWRRIAFGGSVGAGAAYIDGAWSCDDLTGLMRILVRNRDALLAMEGGLACLGGLLDRLAHRLRRNTRRGSRRNIMAHYDLGNEFYGLFLDRARMYSCAYFERDDMDLDAAAVAKLDRICRKLDLRPEDHLLEIGTGWGGMAIHAAKRYGCRVTTATISPSQEAFAARRIAEEGLADRVTVLRRDYRDLQGRYDKLVSIEMIEGVGRQYLDAYFRRCSGLLAPHGRMVLQAIVIADRYYEAARRAVDFIQRYVFPGSHLPSVSALTTVMARATDLRLVDLEDITTHYARTLRLWRERFFARLDEVRALGFSDRFIRLWEYYLCYCEGGFLERSIGDVQMVFAKPLGSVSR